MFEAFQILKKQVPDAKLKIIGPEFTEHPEDVELGSFLDWKILSQFHG